MIRKKAGLKRTYSVLALMLSMALLFGCSSQAAPEAGQASNPITFWYDKTGVAGEAIEKTINSFKQAHPELQVNSVYVADLTVGGGQKLLSAIAGGTGPDVVFFDRFQIASWAEQDALTDLTSLMEQNGVDSSRFYPAAWNEVVVGGKIFGMPVTTDGRVLFYNKDHFKEAGLNPDNPPRTIEELEQAAAQLDAKSADGNRAAFVPWAGQGNFYTWGWTFGGEFYNPDTEEVTANDPNIVAAMQWIQDYANAHDVTKFSAITSNAQLDPFAAGQISMEVGNNLLVSTIKNNNPDLNYGVTPIPAPKGLESTTWSGGYSVVIPRGAKNVEGGFELVKYFAEDTAQEFMAGAYLSVVPEVNEKVFADDPVSRQILGLLDIAHWRPVISQGQLLWNELQSGLETAYNNKANPRDILNDITAKVNEALKQDRQH